MKPVLTCRHALFLDLDGTLLDLAPTPADVVVPDDLDALLTGLMAGRGGALAILSGRTLPDIDAVVGSRFPAGAEHGFLLRDSDGAITRPAAGTANRPGWRSALQQAAIAMPGVTIELKIHTLVAHFRAAPERGPELRAMIEAMIAGDPSVELLEAHMAWEIRPKGVSKGTALDWFMRRKPFADRIPVFIGDDITDESAIDMAREMGGIGLHVARDFGGRTAFVRGWLGEAVRDEAG